MKPEVIACNGKNKNNYCYFVVLNIVCFRRRSTLNMRCCCQNNYQEFIRIGMDLNYTETVCHYNKYFVTCVYYMRGNEKYKHASTFYVHFKLDRVGYSSIVTDHETTSMGH